MYTDKLFTGQREITGLGIYHYGARFYSPKLGRFLSADSIVPNPANPQDFNRFSYVRNNPVRYTDPSGHYCLDPYEARGRTNYISCTPPVTGGGGGGGGGGAGGSGGGGGGGGNYEEPTLTIPTYQPTPTVTPTPLPTLIPTSTFTPTLTATPSATLQIPTQTNTPSYSWVSPASIPSLTPQATLTVMPTSQTMPPTQTMSPTLTSTPTPDDFWQKASDDCIRAGCLMPSGGSGIGGSDFNLAPPDTDTGGGTVKFH